MARPARDRHRRSVALVPRAKGHVDRISEAKGVSGNRAIEDALEFYSKYLGVEQQEHGHIVGVMIKTSTGEEKAVRVLF